ncbi:MULTISPECIES: hypothetical protein [Pseudoalteromonas]|uniref:Lipoprotein n=1 Tax=Pseudoalteromonas rubra TaxID=43658 RepID=A0A5S3V1D3_9GAMM|nr:MULTISPECIES: hypothetical protein [Pseudoalteromonas]MCG7562612.1 hypothetical protein [Pseudoalteromonas sp. McH1-42]QPB84730.1 hypothetical protein CWC22_017780 [Pseudoalteromonas rubra]
MKALTSLLTIPALLLLAACGSDSQQTELPQCDDEDVMELVHDIVKDEVKSQLFDVMLAQAGKSGEITYERAVEVKGRSTELATVLDAVDEAVEQQDLRYSEIAQSSEDTALQKVWCSANMMSPGAEKPAIINYTALYSGDDVEVLVTF